MFDLPAFHHALDREREARGVSWSRLANDVGVSASTIKRMATAGDAEADGVLALARWMGAAPESFTGSGTTAPLVVTGEGMLRTDTRSLFTALDAERTSRGMTWKQLAAEIGCPTAAPLRNLSRGGRTTVQTLVTVADWLDRSVESFTHLTPV